MVMIDSIEFVYYKNYPCNDKEYIDFGQIIYYNTEGDMMDTHNFNRVSYDEFIILYDLFKLSNDVKCGFMVYDLK